MTAPNAYLIPKLPAAKLGDLHLDPARMVASFGDRHVLLTAAMTLILHALMAGPGIIRTRDNLLDAIGDEGDRGERTIDTQIKRIRNRLATIGIPRTIVIVHYGVGYSLAEMRVAAVERVVPLRRRARA